MNDSEKSTDANMMLCTLFTHPQGLSLLLLIINWLHRALSLSRRTPFLSLCLTLYSFLPLNSQLLVEHFSASFCLVSHFGCVFLLDLCAFNVKQSERKTQLQTLLCDNLAVLRKRKWTKTKIQKSWMLLMYTVPFFFHINFFFSNIHMK